MLREVRASKHPLPHLDYAHARERCPNVRLELTLGDEESDSDVEWGAFGFMFALAVLSFADARPRGVSDMHFLERDELGLEDFLPDVRFERGCLTYRADYIRGRAVRTSITVARDGRVSLETAGRGEAPLHWIRRLRGEKRLQALKSRPRSDLTGGRLPRPTNRSVGG